MPAFFNTVLDFSKYVHAPDKPFPQGKLYLQEDMYARFCGVKTQFVIGGKPQDAEELSFYDRSDDALKQLGVLRTYLEAAKQTAEELLSKSPVVETSPPLFPLKRQLAEAELGISVLSRALSTRFINDWA